MTRHSVDTAWFARSADTKLNFVPFIRFAAEPLWQKPLQPCAGSGSPSPAASPRAAVAAPPPPRPCAGSAPRPNRPPAARRAPSTRPDLEYNLAIAFLARG